jgi:hypothetical protein
MRHFLEYALVGKELLLYAIQELHHQEFQGTPFPVLIPIGQTVRIVFGIGTRERILQRKTCFP